jgi:hypothetical protein
MKNHTNQAELEIANQKSDNPQQQKKPLKENGTNK